MQTQVYKNKKIINITPKKNIFPLFLDKIEFENLLKFFFFKISLIFKNKFYILIFVNRKSNEILNLIYVFPKFDKILINIPPLLAWSKKVSHLSDKKGQENLNLSWTHKKYKKGFSNTVSQKKFSTKLAKQIEKRGS